MTDMDCACLIRELMQINSDGKMKTPRAEGYDTMFQCAFMHALRALEERAEVRGVEYTRDGSGYNWQADETLERNMHYRTRSLKELMSCYGQEACRLNWEDKKVTQGLIRAEVDARVKEAFNTLDSSPELIEQIYKQFIEH